METVGAIVGIIAAIIASLGVVFGIWYQLRQRSERLSRVEAQLKELQEKLASSPQGTADIG
ncbi:MAG: hypothetical protein IIB19_05560, partial [Chloroflexi bacterium]|nr:hypothetical protein [Chloroflexota bacterium]